MFDPVSLGIAAVGMGISLYGGINKSKVSGEMTSVQQQIIGQQQKLEEQRMRAMELDATRRQREEIRKLIAGRSLALTTATSQGASQGSVLGGAYGGVSGRIGTNLLGITQNLEIGRSMFGINKDISGLQSQYAGLQGKASEYDAISGFGSMISKNAGTLGQLGKFGVGTLGKIGASETPSPISSWNYNNPSSYAAWA